MSVPTRHQIFLGSEKRKEETAISIASEEAIHNSIVIQAEHVLNVCF